MATGLASGDEIAQKRVHNFNHINFHFYIKICVAR